MIAGDPARSFWDGCNPQHPHSSRGGGKGAADDLLAAAANTRIDPLIAMITQDDPVSILEKPAENIHLSGGRMLHSIGWTGAATWATQLITWAYMIVLARMLTPADFGLVGMANLLLEILTVASEFGVGVAIVMLPDLTENQMSQLNTVALISGGLLFIVSCAAAYPLGYFFKTSALPAVIIVLSIGLLILSFKIVPCALLQREFRFKLLAQIQAAQVMIYAVGAIVSVFWGAGYWSLVIANLAGVCVATLLTLRFRRHSFARPRFSSLRQSLVFSTHVFSARLAWYWNTTADSVVTGRMLGKAALGSYGIAWSLANQPLQKFADLVTRVVPSYFSRVHDNPAALRDYVLTITQVLSLLTLPATLGLALVADDFVALAFGPKWMAAVTPLRLLAIYAAARSITSFFYPLLNVKGQSKFLMWNQVLACTYFTIAFWIGSRWGVGGIALMWPILYPLMIVPVYVKLFKQINLSLREYLHVLRPALTGTIAMIAFVLIVRNILPTHVLYLRLAAEIATGVVSYCLVVLALYFKQLCRLYTLIQPAQKLALATQ